MRRQWLAGMLFVAALWMLALWTPWAEPAAHDAPDSKPLAPTPPPLEPSPQPLAQRASEVPAPDPPQEPDPAEAPAPAPTTVEQPPALPPPEMQGPVRALKQRFQSESSGDSSRSQEQKLTAAIQRSNPPTDLLDDVVCRRSVCRISVRWKSEHRLPLLQFTTELRRDFDPNLAIDEAGTPSADGMRRVEVYIDLASPRAPLP